MATSVHDPIYKQLIASNAAARVDARLTQQVVAARLGRPQSYVAKVEGCERRIDVVEFLHFARAINADPLPLLRSAWKMVRDDRQE